VTSDRSIGYVSRRLWHELPPVAPSTLLSVVQETGNVSRAMKHGNNDQRGTRWIVSHEVRVDSPELEGPRRQVFAEMADARTLGKKTEGIVQCVADAKRSASLSAAMNSTISPSCDSASRSMSRTSASELRSPVERVGRFVARERRRCDDRARPAGDHPVALHSAIEITEDRKQMVGVGFGVLEPKARRTRCSRSSSVTGSRTCSITNAMLCLGSIGPMNRCPLSAVSTSSQSRMPSASGS
jgi:hypothetical protein